MGLSRLMYVGPHSLFVSLLTVLPTNFVTLGYKHLSTMYGASECSFKKKEILPKL
eukprot:c8138_g2_i1 orf=332-496(+)